jgi:hypothetical protein
MLQKVAVISSMQKTPVIGACADPVVLHASAVALDRLASPIARRQATP